MLERSLKQVRNFAGGINGGSHGDISAGDISAVACTAIKLM